jgi:hypothetical protein
MLADLAAEQVPATIPALDDGSLLVRLPFSDAERLRQLSALLRLEFVDVVRLGLEALAERSGPAPKRLTSRRKETTR